MYFPGSTMLSKVLEKNYKAKDYVLDQKHKRSNKVKLFSYTILENLWK